MGYLRSIIFGAFLTITILLTSCGTSFKVNQGVTFYNQGLYNQAAAQWNGPARQGDHSAQYNLGLLWRDGLGSTPENLNEAANWFYLSAKQGYVPAMVRLSEVQSRLGNETPAISWLILAARWGNSEAIQQLKEKGLQAPLPDLYYAEQREEDRALHAILGSNATLLFGQNRNTNSDTDNPLTSSSSFKPNNICNCKGYSGPGGPCYSGPGGPAYDGPGGPAYNGPGGYCYSGPGGSEYDGPGGPAYDGPGGPAYDGPGGPAYDGPGGPAYDGPGGPCYSGSGGPCYSGPGGTGEYCPKICK